MKNLSKKCARCNIVKPYSEFMKCSRNKSGIGVWCKECARSYTRKRHAENKEGDSLKSKEWKTKNPEKIKAYSRKYHQEHREERLAYAKKYAEENKDKIKEYNERTKEQKAARAKVYRQEHKKRDKITRDAWIKANPEKKRDALKRWRAANPEKDRAAMRRANKKRGENIKYRVSGSISRRIRTSLFDNGTKNKRHWEELVDFTVDQLKGHLEKLFKPGMSWENYGTVWEIDHKIPIAAFNFEKPDDVDFRLCWSLKNLQPLEKSENRSKGARIERSFQPSLAIAT
ncbi:MAG: hypothetical protein JRE23_02795 [Deltaproteobacteria bacterium]|nr:hypothetical protein [Deltaproteobacteria bacterium]